MILDQLIHVLDLLKRCGFPQTRWHELGLRLGLHKDTLGAIKRDNDRTNDCLIECLSKWLRRVDNVDSKGGATFDSLSDALKSMNENAASDKLDQESKLISLIVLVLTLCVLIKIDGGVSLVPPLRCAGVAQKSLVTLLQNLWH
uniref:Death domain-containing protein n=1 Tax=Amphimedon queenslandica TaxID=400682 RepID=A0A1X7T2H7_AMPQE